MIDVITYTNDLPALRVWLANNHAAWPEQIGVGADGAYLLLDKTPTFVNGSYSVSLVRVTALDFISASPLEVLNSVPTGEDVFTLSVEAQVKYNLAYPRPVVNVPASTVNGAIIAAYTYQLPAKFGDFAS